jgi:hypothetical protein
MEFVVTAFQVSRTVLQDAITVHQSGTGFFALIDNSIFDIKMVRKVRQTSEMREECHPVYKLKHRQPVYDLESGLSRQTWLYHTENDVIFPYSFIYSWMYSTGMEHHGPSSI